MAAELIARCMNPCATDFVSANCLREVVAAIEQRKPRIVVHEPDPAKGGGQLEELRNELINGEHRDAIFSNGTSVITWYRLTEFQLRSYAARI